MNSSGRPSSRHSGAPQPVSIGEEVEFELRALHAQMSYKVWAVPDVLPSEVRDEELSLDGWLPPTPPVGTP